MPRKKQNRTVTPVPLKMVQDFKQKFPDVWEYCDCSLNVPLEQIDFAWDQTRCVIPSYICMPIMKLMYEKYDVEQDMSDVAILSGLYSWRKYKEIYSFDADFAELLMESADDEITIPPSTLLSMPYPSFYVQINDENSLGAKGFFCNYDYLMWGEKESNGTKRQLTLNFLAVYEDKFLGCPFVIREGLSIKDSIKWMNMLMSEMTLEMTGKMGYDPELIQFAHDFITKALQLVLYICAANADISSWQKSFLRLDLRAGQPQGRFWENPTPSHGDSLTLNIGESPNVAVESSLSQILEDSAPERYYLSPKACVGILHRAQRRGKDLPPRLKAALENQAGIQKETE